MTEEQATSDGRIPPSKICGRCEQELPASAFSRNRQSADGLQNWCTVCHREYRRERAKSRSVQGLVHQQKAGNGGNWARGDPEEYDKLCAHVFYLRTTKHESLRAVSEELGIPYRTVYRMFAHAQRRLIDGDIRSHFRHMAVTHLEEIAQAAYEEGDWGESRKAIMDMGKLFGVVSTGGNVPSSVNVGVQVNNTPEQMREIEDEAVQYLEDRRREMELESPEGASKQGGDSI